MADLNLGGRLFSDISDDLARKIFEEIRFSEKPSHEELNRKCQVLKQKIITKRGKRFE